MLPQVRQQIQFEEPFLLLSDNYVMLITVCY
jgi:hypothetical protein